MSTNKPGNTKTARKKQPPRAASCKQATVAPVLSADGISIPADDSHPKATKLEQANIEKMILQAFNRYKQEEIQDNKSKVKEVDHLSHIIEEYLSCFVLIGYSLQDEKVCVFNAHTSKDEAALVDHLRATFLDIVNNRP